MDLKGLQGAALQDRSRLEGELAELLEKAATLRLMKAALPQTLANEWDRVESDMNRQVLDLLLGLRAFGCEFMIVENISDSSESEIASTGPLSELNIQIEYDGVRPADAAADPPSEAVPAADDTARSNAPTDSAADESPDAGEASTADAPVPGTEEALDPSSLLSVDPILTPPPVRLIAKQKPDPVVAPAVPEWREALRELLEQWLPWQESPREVRRLIGLIEPFNLWHKMPTDAIRYMLECAAARIRSLQDCKLVSETDCIEAIGLLQRIRLLNGDFFVYGLSRDHRPRQGNWDSDALQALEGLRRRGNIDVTASWSLASSSRIHPTTPQVSPRRESAVPVRVLPVLEKPASDNEVLDAPPPPRLADDTTSELVGHVQAAIELASEAPEDDNAAVTTLLDELRHAFSAGLPADNEQLVALCAPYLGVLAGDEFAALRAAIERLTKEDEEPANGASLIPQDWPLWNKTRNRKAIIFGGNPSEERRVKIKEAFAFGDLEWIESRKPRLYQGLVERIRRKRYDLVIILRFTWHKGMDAVIRACGDEVEYVYIEHGYNIARIREAIERFNGNGRIGRTR